MHWRQSMARRIRNPKVDTPTARHKLKVRREPYWTVLQHALALGYRRGPGTWIGRRYDPTAIPRLTYEALGAADDANDGRGLSFDAAQQAAREWAGQAIPVGAGTTLSVKQA